MLTENLDLRLFSSDAFFLRTFTYVCSIRVNERIYVFWALRTYTYVKKTHHWKTAFTPSNQLYVNWKSRLTLSNSAMLTENLDLLPQISSMLTENPDLLPQTSSMLTENLDLLPQTSSMLT